MACVKSFNIQFRCSFYRIRSHILFSCLLLKHSAVLHVEVSQQKARTKDTLEAMHSPLSSCNIISGPLINLALEEK